MDEVARRCFTISESTANGGSQVPFDEKTFRRLYFYEPPPEESLCAKIKKTVRCNSENFLSIIPILKWLPSYRKKDLASDVIAGFTVAVMHIPQGMAYALLGGVPPVVGIYMAFFPVLVYILLGTSPHVSMGTFAVVCMMVGKSVDSYSHSHSHSHFHSHHDNSTLVSYIAHPPLTPTEVATAVCFIVGIWQVVLSILKLGSLSVLLSQTLVSGFTTGAAVHVLTSQIRNLLGIKVKRYSGPLKIIYSFVDIFSNIANLNLTAAILSVIFIIFLVIFNEFIKPYIQKKCKRTVPLPVELVVVVIGTLLSQNLNMKEKYGLAVVDSVPTGLPNPSIPPLHLLPSLIVDGLVVAIVAISINISMASIFAQKLGYEIDGNQEIFASGVGNIFASFFSCMPFAASLSRSLIQESVGGKTQVTSIVSSLSLVLVLLFVGPFFEPLPYCVLSTIIVVALKGMFVQFKDLPSIYRNSKLDGFVWIATFFSVVILDIDYGLGIGLVASIVTLLLRNQKCEVVVLGRVPDTLIYLDLQRFQKAQKLPNILILKLVGGLHFANSSSVRKEIIRLLVKQHKDLAASLVDDKKPINLSLVLDFSSVPYIDATAIKDLSGVCEDISKLDSNLLICGCLSAVYESLERSQNFENFPKDLIFHNLHDAVTYAEKLVRSDPEGMMKFFKLKF